MSFTLLQDVLSTVGAGAITGARAITGITNPITSRLRQGGLLGGVKQNQKPSFDIKYVNKDSGTMSQDWRVRVTLASSSDIFFRSSDAGILAPLRDTNGVIFPYTPTITVASQTNYSQQRFTHGNYNHFAYENSEVQQIQIQADFTAQNRDEAAYVLACIYFFRAASKMFFGQGKYAGNPPPIVFLNGYGEHYFKDLPCILTTFSHTMPNDVDYIESRPETELINSELGLTRSTEIFGTGTRIPTISQMSLNLQPVYSKDRVTEFNLDEFAKGRLVQRGFI